MKISPIALNRWLVAVKDLRTNAMAEKQFDSIMICVGHYSVPMIPTLPGKEDFGGTIVHSHNYRNTKPYAQRNVLIIGSGPSGTDIAILISQKAEKVIKIRPYSKRITS